MYTLTKKQKTVIYSITALTIFSTGLYSRPAFDLAGEFTTAIFTNEKYVAPLSEYESKVNALWQSQPHQAVCKSNAAATVALQLARKYLDEGEKQSALSNYDLPATEAITNTKNYGNR